VPIAEIEAEQVCVRRLIDRPWVASWARDLSRRGHPGRDMAAASAPVPDGGDRYPTDLSVLFIKNANSG